MQNEAIIIGNDHCNTLGVLRILGENGIFPIVYIIDNSKFIAISKSKYIKEMHIFPDEQEAIEDIKKRFSNSSLKPVLIPTSDKAASAIDIDYNDISKVCMTQNINNKNNLINKYMDKYEQYKLSEKYNIKMARSEILKFPYNYFDLLNKFNFPIIIKPLLSIDGKKEDIIIASNKEDFEKKFNLIKDKYTRFLVQEYITYDYECDMSGFIFGKKVSIAGIIKKYRIWPEKRGSMTFGRICNYKNYLKEINSITKLLIDLNYSGLFDIDFFIKGNDIYLNEINFRNGALTYLYDKSYICYYYYLSCVNNNFIKAPIIKEEYFVMDEQAEIHQILEKKVKISEYIKDRKKSKTLLYYNKNDKRPSYRMIENKIYNKISKFNILKKIYHVWNKVNIYKYDKDMNFNADITNYTFKKIDKNNYKSIAFDKKDERYFKKIVNSKKYYCLVLVIDNKIVGRGIIKFYRANDYYIKIANKNSVLFSSLYVHSQYRGNGYQKLLFCKMVEISNKMLANPNIYAVVNQNNIPSKKNVLKSGFKEIDNVEIKRFMGISLNKYKI